MEGELLARWGAEVRDGWRGTPTGQRRIVVGALFATGLLLFFGRARDLGAGWAIHGLGATLGLVSLAAIGFSLRSDRRLRREGVREATWRLVAIWFGLTILAGGVAQRVVGAGLLTPGLHLATSLPFMVASAFGLVGLGLLGRRLDPDTGLAGILDALITTTALGIVLWYSSLAGVWHEVATTRLSRFQLAAMPVFDLLFLFVSLVVLGAPGLDARRRLLAILAGLAGVSQCFADLAVARSVLRSATLGPYDVVWSGIGFVLVAAGLAYQCLPPDTGATGAVPVRAAGPGSPLLAFFRGQAHYVATGLALLSIAAFDWITNRTVHIAGFGEVTLLIVMLFVRQLVVVRDNVRLKGKVDSSNAVLRSLVEHLKSLNNLTSAINVQLEARTVLQTASEHIREVLGVDAIFLGRETEGKVEASWYATGDPNNLLGLMLQGRVQKNLPIQLTESDESGEQSFAAVCPILWDGSLAGRIVAVRRGRSFGYGEIHLLANIAGEVAKALLNATKHERALDAADRDPVTGLLNHRAFHQRLQTGIEHARKEGSLLSLAMIDMNNFKLFNDTYGHLAGDQVLRQVSEALLIECPTDALLARYGGDEYAIATPGYGEEELVHLAERIRDRLLQTGFIDPSGTKVPIALAFGIACFPEDAHHRHDLINVADGNLYDAKHSEGGIRGASASQRENRELKAHASFETLDALVSAVDNKDRYTRKHSEDVTEYALWIAEEVGFSEEAKRAVRRAGLLHDVGKIGVPDAILRKPGRLTPEEFEIVQRHPRLGELIVSAIPGMEDIVDGVRAHHERWDGAGYPDALTGEAIPLMGRILAVADAYSAMTTDRPYRKGMDHAEAVRRIEAGVGTQFDPTLAEHFLTAARRRFPTSPIAGEERRAA